MDATAATHRRYLRGLAACAGLVALLGAAANFIVDPYDLFGTPRINGVNALKPASAERVRVVKPYQAERMGPRVIIGGNSRPELGLDPRSPCWQDDEQPEFNAGNPGADFRLQMLYARHAAASGTATKIPMGVDFLDFLTDKTRIRAEPAAVRRPSQDEMRLRPDDAAPSVEHQLQRARDRLTALFSLTTLTDSIATIAAQRNPDAGTRREDGFNPARDDLAIIQAEGQSVLFEQKNDELRARLQNPALSLRDGAGNLSGAFHALEGFLAWADKRGAAVVLFMNPYHADYLRIIQKAGLWPALEDWKREIARIAADNAVPVLDFQSLNPYAMEAPPAAGDMRTILHWLWEPAHYRSELGEVMLALMLSRDCATALPASNPPFGTRLTDSNQIQSSE